MKADHAVIRYGHRMVRVGVLTAQRMAREGKIVVDPETDTYIVPGLTIYYYVGV